MMLSVLLLTLVSTVLGQSNMGYTRKVLLISMDGFRYDYLNKTHTPNFDRFIEQGAQVGAVKPVFVTKTFPTHYTIVTGLHPESHGIVDNRMYDPEHKAYFSMSSRDGYWWNRTKPVWTEAQEQGLRANIFFWPGSEADRSLKPDYWFGYDKDVPFRTRVQVVTQWFENDHADFVGLYFYEPDWTGHIKGPDSEELKTKVQEMDNLLGYLVDRMNSSGVLDDVNIIVTSDHGMTNMNKTTQLIKLVDYVNSSLIEVVSSGPVVTVRVAAGYKESVYSTLKSAHPRMKVYRKNEVPSRFHYSNSDRLHDLVLIGDEGWNIGVDGKFIYDNVGGHGWDNELENMKPIFAARGPNIKPGWFKQQVHQTDIYPLLCQLLQINGHKNNGSLSSFESMLRLSPLPPKPTDTVSSSSAPSLLAVILVVCAQLLVSRV